MKIIWTEEALGCLRGIESYIAQDNPEAAKKFTGDLVAATVKLENNPEL